MSEPIHFDAETPSTQSHRCPVLVGGKRYAVVKVQNQALALLLKFPPGTVIHGAFDDDQWSSMNTTTCLLVEHPDLPVVPFEVGEYPTVNPMWAIEVGEDGSSEVVFKRWN